MSPDPGPSTEIRLDTRARRPPPTDQPAHGDAYGMTQATAASLTILRHPLPAARSFVLALLRALHLAPRLRSAEPSQQRRAAGRGSDSGDIPADLGLCGAPRGTRTPNRQIRSRAPGIILAVCG